MRRLRAVRAAGLLLAALVLASACAEGEGIVEVYWQFEDRNLRRIFPQGDVGDTCEFTSASGIRYDLRVRLRVLENTEACVAAPDDAACQIIDPVLFPCNRRRGTADLVPVSAREDGSDPGYLMIVEALIDPTDGPAFVPNSTCLIGPGPRVRKVRPGRITDLEVYQFIVDAVTLGAYDLDLDACR
ncbi:MAG: hypothetical protein R6X02_14515 [Enhygromyxa sp.]